MTKRTSTSARTSSLPSCRRGLSLPLRLYEARQPHCRMLPRDAKGRKVEEVCGGSDPRTESKKRNGQSGCRRGPTVNYWASRSLAALSGFSRCQSCRMHVILRVAISSRLPAFATLVCHHPRLSDLYTLGIPRPGRSCVLQSKTCFATQLI